jgi:predicted transcriptional regulator
MSENLDPLPAIDSVQSNTVRIVTSFLSFNHLPAGDLPNLISTVHKSLVAIDEPPLGPMPVAAVARRDTVAGIFCRVCGKGPMKTLTRHLRQAHALTPGNYQVAFKGARVVSTGYSASRSKFAKSIGLGRPGGSKPPAVSASRNATKRSGARRRK